jgi:hypothetical protein
MNLSWSYDVDNSFNKLIRVDSDQLFFGMLFLIDFFLFHP